MKIVIVDGDVSYPATSGKRLRTLNLMLHAAQRHQVIYVGRCAENSEEARTAPAFLRRDGPACRDCFRCLSHRSLRCPFAHVFRA